MEPATETSLELLIHASRLLAYVWNQHLEELGITQAGYIALSVAAASQAPHQTTIARALHVSTPTIRTTLDRLERHGHVTSHRNAHDARYRMIRVTALGLSILRAGQEIEQSLLARAEGLRDQLLQILPNLMKQPGAA